MDVRNFNVPATKISLIDNQLTKFNKRAFKLGMETLTWSWGKAFSKEVERVIKHDSNAESIIENIMFIPLQVSGTLSLKFEDHKFIATLQHLRTGENIIRAISNEMDIPNEYRTSGSNCQHCETNRYRKDTYLLLNLKNNQVIQCGSLCMSDLLGKHTPENLLNKACLISEIISFVEGSCVGGTGGDIVFSIIDFLAHTNAVIRDFGWISKSKSFLEKKKSTSSLALDNILPSQGLSKIISKVSQEDFDKSILANEWCENISDVQCDGNDYLFNIRAICRSGLVGMRTVGFAASIIPAYDRFIKATTPNTDNIISQHIGCIKERIQLNLTVKRDIAFQNAYGEGHYYIFYDDNNNVVVWRSSKDCFLTENKKYFIKGTIKSHDLYKNVPQTTLTRCQVLESYD